MGGREVDIGVFAMKPFDWQVWVAVES